MAEQMNIYQKLQTCRVELQKSDLTKSGRNEYSNYDYFELGDFLPKTNELFAEYRLIGIVSPGESAATLTIRDTDKPEDTIVFSCPNAEITLKGAHSIQNIGAVKTYQRRYLWIDAMEISEKDTVDRSEGKAEEERPVEMTFEEASVLKINFGKHKGKTAMEILDKHPDWVQWFYENGSDKKLNKAFQVIEQHLHGELDFETVIDSVKVAILKKIVAETDTREADFLRFCKVERYEDITTDTFVKAMQMLEAKKAKIIKTESVDLPI